MRSFFLGVVADDFTGASDAASFLVEAGVPTVLFNGVPAACPELKDDTAAVVVALKTRTMPKAEAVKESLAAFEWLKTMGAEKLYFKYCSTFDSTAEGNIGPVADAVLERYGIRYTVLCPSLPVNGRTVKDGILYVYGVPLSESHMKDHPLTPMRNSSVPELMEAQSKYHAISLHPDEECEIIKDEPHYYLVPDYAEDKEADRIAEAFWDLPFLTGGSGLAGALGRRYAKLSGTASGRCDGSGTFREGSGDGSEMQKERAASGSRERTETDEGKAILVAGSCSAITLKQIAAYQEAGYPSLRVIPQKLLSGEETADGLWKKAENLGSNVLLYSSAAPEDLKKSQAFGQERVAAMLEQTLSGLAKRAAGQGYTRIISAGGETSGAVTQALGCSAFYIGSSVAPGVPVMIPVERPELRLVLKSGNFGQEDFFERALALTRD